ncbi:MAG: hypothetical protein WC349_02295 [Patescibacteria group bacterium]|jgi:hypothetical protein
MASNKVMIYSLVVFLLVGSIILGVLTWTNLQTKTIQNNSPVATTSTEVIDIATTTPTQATSTVEIEWLAEPVKLGDLKLIARTSYSEGEEGVGAESYYKVANTIDGGEIINAFMPPEGPSVNLVIRFKKTSDGKYFLIKKNSDYEDDSGLVSKVTIDSVTDIKVLNAPAKILINNITFTKKEWSDKMPADWSKLKKIGITENGDFYKKLTADDYNLYYAQYVLKLPDSTAMYYDMPYNFLADDNSLIATFNSDNQEFKTKRINTSIVQGCSTLGNLISEDDLSGRLQVIGQTTSSGALYAPKNVDDELFKAVYDVYKIGREGATDYAGNKVLSYEEFVAKKSVVIWRDLLGDYHIFYDSDYSPMAECGKPVIYLYPENKSDVKVRVGAKIRVSEPDYGDGWKVTAYPDGKIINSDSGVYENLYWEGKGYGYYPAITKGRIVKQANIEAELISDLAALGLNKKESADFMEFWLPKMPKTPYIRLTWLDTTEMNALAPLAISPRPDTVKRIFLDFSGQATEATDLALQKLNGFKRIGFTVVEWGGLLIGGK